MTLFFIVVPLMYCIKSKFQCQVNLVLIHHPHTFYSTACQMCQCFDSSNSFSNVVGEIGFLSILGFSGFSLQKLLLKASKGKFKKVAQAIFGQILAYQTLVFPTDVDESQHYHLVHFRFQCTIVVAEFFNQTKGFILCYDFLHYFGIKCKEKEIETGPEKTLSYKLGFWPAKDDG